MQSQCTTIMHMTSITSFTHAFSRGPPSARSAAAAAAAASAAARISSIAAVDAASRRAAASATATIRDGNGVSARRYHK